jgi:hypothetical protein
MIGGVHLAALRSIAHEVPVSIDGTAPDLLRRKYMPSVPAYLLGVSPERAL